MKNRFASLVLVRGIAVALLWTAAAASLPGQEAVSPAAATRNIPYSDARAILQVLQEGLLPAELRARTPAAREADWPDWVARRDATIRARLADGDEDSVINILLFGTTFTRQPRITEHELAGLVVRAAGTSSTRFLPSPLLLARIGDFLVAVASPGTNERMQFVRQVIERKGMDPGTEAGRIQIQRYLEERTAIVGSAVHLPTLLDPGADPIDRLTLFRDRGLASDTSLSIDFGIEQALADLKARGLLQPGAVRRVGIVGPGLDFTDKQEGHDFYPQQTIQPFAVIDSLIRLGLATPGALHVTAFDLSPRIIAHLEAAGARARAGDAYALVLPRDLDRSWTPDLVKYWERFGDRIGQSARAAPPPPSAGRVEVRRILVRPSMVLATTARDLNIVLQRIDPLPEGDRFDLLLATNILIYYDVFEQSLAAANIATMLRPGGIFLSNDRIVELPDSPIGSVGQTDVTYMEQPGTAARGDRITWYRRQ